MTYRCILSELVTPRMRSVRTLTVSGHNGAYGVASRSSCLLTREPASAESKPVSRDSNNRRLSPTIILVSVLVVKSRHNRPCIM